MILGVLLVVLGLRSEPARASNDIAIPQAESSIVFVEGAESGTGFVFRNRGTSTYVLTSAHLLDRDRYEADARVADVGLRKAATDWLTVYDTYAGKPYVATIVGAPDFVDDVVVLKVVGMAKRPRTLCLASLVPPNAPFAVTSFDVDVLQDPPFGRQLTPLSTNGLSTTPIRSQPNEFQYASAIEQGFSGGPIYDTDSGAVFGLVRRSPLVRDPSTGAFVVSPSSHYGVAIGAIATMLGKLEQSDPQLSDLATIDERDRHKLVPVLSGHLRIVTFDSIRSGGSLYPVFKPYDSAMRALIGLRFGGPSGSALLDPDTAVYPIDMPVTAIANICRISDTTDAAGVLALRRDLSTRPGVRTVDARVALVACNGHIVDRADLETTPMDQTGPTPEQTQLFVKHLGVALDRLADGNDQRLANFAADGLPLGDDESRGFYDVRHDGTSTYLHYGWTGGAAAAVSKLFDERAVVSISGMPPGAISTMTSADLDRRLDRSDAPVIATLRAPDGTTTNVALASNDRCAYLRRRKINGPNDFISGQTKVEQL